MCLHVYAVQFLSGLAMHVCVYVYVQGQSLASQLALLQERLADNERAEIEARDLQEVNTRLMQEL